MVAEGGRAHEGVKRLNSLLTATSLAKVRLKEDDGELFISESCSKFGGTWRASSGEPDRNEKTSSFNGLFTFLVGLKTRTESAIADKFPRTPERRSGGELRKRVS